MDRIAEVKELKDGRWLCVKASGACFALTRSQWLEVCRIISQESKDKVLDEKV